MPKPWKMASLCWGSSSPIVPPNPTTVGFRHWTRFRRLEQATPCRIQQCSTLRDWLAPGEGHTSRTTVAWPLLRATKRWTGSWWGNRCQFRKLNWILSVHWGRRMENLWLITSERCSLSTTDQFSCIDNSFECSPKFPFNDPAQSTYIVKNKTLENSKTNTLFASLTYEYQVSHTFSHYLALSFNTEYKFLFPVD